MGEIADAMIEGRMCCACGVCFEKEHGYPVLCNSCWRRTPKDERKASGYQKALHKEL